MNQLSPMTSTRRLLNESEVAELLGVRTATLQAWRTDARRQPLPYVKLGRLVRYAREDVEEFLRKSRQGANAEAV